MLAGNRPKAPSERELASERETEGACATSTHDIFSHYMHSPSGFASQIHLPPGGRLIVAALLEENRQPVVGAIHESPAIQNVQNGLAQNSSRRDYSSVTPPRLRELCATATTEGVSACSRSEDNFPHKGRPLIFLLFVNRRQRNLSLKFFINLSVR